MTYSFFADAELEFFEAINFLDERREGLGKQFAREIFASINRIVRFPSAYAVYTKRTRRCLIRKFPYAIIYRVRDEEVVIYSIMHLSRDPNYWTDRLGDDY